MATRTRIVFQTPASRFYGSRAVLALAQAASRAMFGPWPANWTSLSKREKLIFMAEKCPPNHKLSLFQEAKATRRTHSLYWDARQGRRD